MSSFVIFSTVLILLTFSLIKGSSDDKTYIQMTVFTPSASNLVYYLTVQSKVVTAMYHTFSDFNSQTNNIILPINNFEQNDNIFNIKAGPPYYGITVSTTTNNIGGISYIDNGQYYCLYVYTTPTLGLYLDTRQTLTSPVTTQAIISIVATTISSPSSTSSSTSSSGSSSVPVKPLIGLIALVVIAIILLLCVYYCYAIRRRRQQQNNQDQVNSINKDIAPLKNANAYYTAEEDNINIQTAVAVHV